MPLAMPIIETQHFSEEIPGLTQAKLCMLFTRGTPEDLPSITVMRMAMSVFGGSTTSRLFRNVREKQSLCYYCGSSALRATGVMMVDSGVEPGREAQAEAAILKELNDLCTGPITEQEMDDCAAACFPAWIRWGIPSEDWKAGTMARSCVTKRWPRRSTARC